MLIEFHQGSTVHVDRFNHAGHPIETLELRHLPVNHDVLIGVVFFELFDFVKQHLGSFPYLADRRR